MKIIHPNIQETQQSVSTRNMKKNYKKSHLIKLLKTSTNEKILKAARGKRYIIYRGTKIKQQNIVFQKQRKSEDDEAIFHILQEITVNLELLTQLKIYFK